VSIKEHPGGAGVLAFGDSITNGGGELQYGVALQSWALWVARGLGAPYSGYAADGARVRDVVDEQIPLHRLLDRDTPRRYTLGCLYIGVNDVRAFDWDAPGFARDHAAALAYLDERCDRVLCVTIPRDLGRPRAGAKVDEGNAIITAAARGAGALILDLTGFGARNLLMADHIHPTAFGQIAIAEQALDVLAEAGLLGRVRPRSLVRYDITRWKRLRFETTYAYRHAKVSAQEVLIRAGAARRTAAHQVAACWAVARQFLAVDEHDLGRRGPVGGSSAENG
jgi:lysophospholipase L1-like esterase